MNYNQFKKNYSYARKIMDISEFFGILNKKIAMAEKIHYKKSGSRWIETSRQTRVMTAENYLNSIECIPFFKGLGSYERTQKNYTKYGYIVTRLYSISPDKKEKYEFNFKFDYDYYEKQVLAIINRIGGWREKDIVKNDFTLKLSDTWNQNHKVIRITKLENDTEINSCEVDLVTRKITG